MVRIRVRCCLAAVLGLILVAAVPADPTRWLSPAWADDGDGDGGGAGGGSGGSGAGSGGDGGYDPWNPGRNSARRSGKCRCQSFLFLKSCNCSEGTTARRRTREKAIAAAPTPAPAAEPRASRELVVLGLSAQQLATLEGQGYIVRGQFQSALVGQPVARLAVPRSTSERRALAQVRSLAPGSVAAPNSLYRRSRFSSYRAAGESCGDRCEAFNLTAWSPASGRCAAGMSIGVIDTGVDVAHPSLAGALVTTQTTRSPDRPASDTDHGTGVVSLLAGLPGSPVVGLAYGARILAADAFHGTGDGSAADTFDVVRSLDWLAGANVRLLNMSLTGTDNTVLKAAVEATLAKGVVVIAAAGRPDEGSKLGYPARYAGVVAVAAVDARLRPSRLSARGRHITFAAPGVGLVVAGANGSLRKVDGTSFAAPFVTAAYAQALTRHAPPRIEEMLAASARDLGAPGRDDTYGWGVVQFAGLPPC